MGYKISDSSYKIEPAAGTPIIADEWPYFHYLIADDTNWEPCDFRVRMANDRYQIAVRVEVTGRTIQRKFSTDVVRIKIIFVGDGTPDVEVGGWMEVQWGILDRK